MTFLEAVQLASENRDIRFRCVSEDWNIYNVDASGNIVEVVTDSYASLNSVESLLGEWEVCKWSKKI